MSVNKVMLIGRLGKDPHFTQTPNGNMICKFSLATSTKYKDQSGQKQEKTTWHNIVVWQRLAETCRDYLKKGSQVYLEGELGTRNYDDKDGKKVYVTEITASTVRFLDEKKKEANNNYSNSGF